MLKSVASALAGYIGSKRCIFCRNAISFRLTRASTCWNIVSLPISGTKYFGSRDGAAEHNELAGFLIGYHGVSASDALHQRASEFRLSLEERGKPISPPASALAPAREGYGDAPRATTAQRISVSREGTSSRAGLLSTRLARTEAVCPPYNIPQCTVAQQQRPMP